jgi:hypothetical protein
MFASVLREFAPVFIDLPVQQSLEILIDSVRTLKKNRALLKMKACVKLWQPV